MNDVRPFLGRNQPGRRLHLVAASLLATSFYTAGSAAAGPPICRRAVNVPLASISSATYANNKVVVVDALGRGWTGVGGGSRQAGVYLFNSDGTFDRELGDVRSNPVGDFLPTRAISLGSQLLIKLIGPGAVRLDENFTTQVDLDIYEGRTGSYNGIGSIYQWASSGREVLFLGTVRPPASSVALGLNQSAKAEFGFARVTASSAGDPADLRFGKPTMVLEARDSDYMVLGQPYVTVASGYFYFAAPMPGAKAPLYRLPVKGGTTNFKEVGVLNDGKPLPELQRKNWGPDDAKALFQEVSGLEMPAALVGFGDRLLVLDRKGKVPSGQVRWYLTQYGVGAGGALAPIGKPWKLPTGADFLSLVATPDTLLVFEKGPANDMGKMTVLSVIRIEKSALLGARDLGVTSENLPACEAVR
ncbi:MAG: hypothetical protein U0002_21725 [Thermoanaerobaculia bacterium]